MVRSRSLFAGVLSAALLASAAQSQSPARSTGGNTIGLSDAQKADILSHNTEQSVADARTGLPGSGTARAIHGEIGAEIGTHGERGMFGAAAIPLSDSASATVMFENQRYGRR